VSRLHSRVGRRPGRVEDCACGDCGSRRALHWLNGLLGGERRWTRRRGRILDERTLGHAIRYVPFYAALFLIGQIPVRGDWQPWFSIGGGLAATVLAFAYIRLDERYQIKRLAAGDFSRHDLV
jgi:hypothetical protein